VQNGYHPPVEQYLAAIWELEEEGVEVIRARLAERVGHTAPSVSELVRRLQSDGYLVVRGRVLDMTPQGRQLAVSVVRKNRLAERLLTDVIGIPWHRIHEEACRWEHVISDDVEQHLVVLLKNPATCPHGNAIPGAGGRRRDLSVLQDSAPGDQIRLERVSEKLEMDVEALVYLDDHGFIPGSSGVVRSKAPDGTITVDVDGTSVALGPALAGLLFVCEVGPDTAKRGSRGAAGASDATK